MITKVNPFLSTTSRCSYAFTLMQSHETWNAAAVAYLSLEVEQTQSLELHCGFSPEVRRQRAWQTFQFLDSMCNPSLQPERHYGDIWLNCSTLDIHTVFYWGICPPHAVRYLHHWKFGRWWYIHLTWDLSAVKATECDSYYLIFRWAHLNPGKDFFHHNTSAIKTLRRACIHICRKNPPC